MSGARDPGAATVDELLAKARSRIGRLTPQEARAAMAEGATLVDIRAADQIARDGAVPGAAIVPRNVLEWRLDPSCEHRDPALARTDRAVIVLCNEGYQSSLAAATLASFGHDAADVIGGAQAWSAAGLPMIRTDESAAHLRRRD
jgi:rhodanese-related sulfurtransferase